MAVVVMIRVLRSRRSPLHRVSLAVSLALCLCLAVCVPAAKAQDDALRRVWSMQVHGGVFAPIEAKGTSPMVGARYCKHYSPHFYGGMLAGWTRKSTSLEQPAVGPDPGPRVELARATAQLVPLMAFVQVNLTEKSRLVPLLGVGAGYEWLTLDLRDHRTGVESHLKYGNMAWETYGGVALRLNSIWRLSGEVFYNGGSLQRHVRDASGHTWIEAVH